MKHFNHLRYRNSWMDFCMDGMKPTERIKGADKKLLRKWTKRFHKKEADNQIKEELI